MARIARERLTALHGLHSFFSFGAGASSPERLVARAAELGYRHVTLTDALGVYGAVELHRAAREHGLGASIGATVPVQLGRGTYGLPLIAASRRGYANLNELLTLAHAQDEPAVPLPVLRAHAHDLHALTGGRRGFLTRLLQARAFTEARRALLELKGIFPDRLWVQLYFDHLPDDRRRARYLREVAHEERLPVVLAPEVRYATPDLFPLLDALVCARLGITVEDPHPERPRNDAQAVPDPARIPVAFPDAVLNAARLAELTRFELLPERLACPPARVPDGLTADAYLEERCYAALLERYRGEALTQAKERLERELATVRALGLTEFFLVAAEVTDFCRSRGILASGRGSAAASILCYLLGVTKANPIEHDLLFERFLHTGRTSMPDVDIDIGSSRRDEVLAWVEERFGARTEAMVCNRITYRLPSAIQDLGRALGIPPEGRHELTRALGRDHRHLRPHAARAASEVFDEVLGRAPVKDALIRLLTVIEPGFVRHIAPHSGGVVLSRDPLTHYSPLERSSGGIRLLQFDKDDTEALGLIKLDLLGLRMLGAIERAREEIYRVEGEWVDVDAPPQDPDVWAAIQEGDTMGVFQIESPGQVRMSVQLRPANLTDLAHQVALFRPGPIQSNTVRPYVARRQGHAPTRVPHPALEPILGRTHGVLLFQEDVLRIAVHFAGFSWSDAEAFRRAAGTFEDEHEIRSWLERFVRGAVERTGCSEGEALEVFELVSAFRGYGFTESHAWSFAQHAYTSAWLRQRYPAEYLAAVMTEHPGMWSHATLRQEALRRGVGFGRLDINRGRLHYLTERDGDRKRLRPPLTAVKGVGRDAALALLVERLRRGAFAGARDAFERTRVPLEALEALARAGAFDRLQGRREALFELQALRHTQPRGESPLFRVAPEPPPLPPLGLGERIVWDYATKGFTEHGVHPVDLVRQELVELGALPMALVRDGWVRTAGLVVARQKPPTAQGFAFFVIEDGTERMQVVIHPELWERETVVFRDARVLVVDGMLERAGRAWTLRASHVLGVAGPVEGKGYHYA